MDINEKFEELYEETKLEEHCGECEMGITEEVSVKEFDALKKGDTVTIEFKSPMSTGKATFKVTAKNVVGKARIEKVTLKDVKRPSGVKFFLYKRGNKVSLAQGDMAASVVSFMKEDKDLEKMVKELEGASKMHLGQSKRIAKYLNKKKEEVEEGIDIEKASIGAVIKDFQKSDAPQFKGKSDKKRKEMAIAAKLSKEENEDDDPVGKSKKKDKVNLKPKMEDKQMKKLKELYIGLQKKRAQDGTLKRVVSDYHKEQVIKEATGSITLTVKGISDLKKADAQMLRDTDFNIEAILQDDGAEIEEGGSTFKRNTMTFEADSADMKIVQTFAKRQTQLSKDTAKLIKPKMDYGDLYEERVDSLYVAGLLSRTAKPNSPLQYSVNFVKEGQIKEAVLDNGLEVGEQEFDLEMRVDKLYPNLDVNFAKYMDEGLEGPYEVSGEVYFYDRKVQMFYSVSGEDYVDEETAKEIAFRLHKDGFYKPDLGR